MITTEAGFYTGLFAFLGVGEQVLNGWKGTHFSINDLVPIYGWIAAYLAANHATNSIFNSPKGELPK